MDLKLTFGLFLKTYHKDFIWLPYLFRSINKFVTGFDHMVIIVDTPAEERELKDMRILPTGFKVDVAVCSRPHDFHGYVFQQYVKLKAFDYLHTDYIMYVDSDCLFQRPFNPSDLLTEDGRPIIYKTHYSRIDSPWKPITEQAVGYPVEWEYMRRHPFMYHRDTLVKLFEFKQDIYDYTRVRSQAREFSEFNYIGAYAEKFEPSWYHFQDTEFGLPDPFIYQSWSWGGLTDVEREKMEEILK